MDGPTVRLPRSVDPPTQRLRPVGGRGEAATVVLPVQDRGGVAVLDRTSAAPAPAGPDELAGRIQALSRGAVRAVRPSGPVFERSRNLRRRLGRATFEPVLGPGSRVVVAVLSIAWVAALVVFWTWLLHPAHRVGTLGLLLNGTILLYLSVMPVYFVVGVNRLRRVAGHVGVPDLRVAFVVTRAPSEPWEVARTTLSAMLDQDYPRRYDVWLCDERTTDEIRRWCAGHGVKLSTREGVEAYHRLTWPRRTKCKEGNLAFFYDHGGYRDYDVVAQLDCDHVPTRSYLREMVRPFADPAIGYVSAPSVCDANAAESWAARGRLHREATFHGPAQLGHSAGLAPVCIGSHYAVRTAALAEIGGIGPELAEDFSTSFLLNSAGWHGAFAIDAEAHGDGPPTFAAMLVQEFQWSRSLTTVLLGLVPSHLGRLPWRLRLRFLYALSYYLLLSLTTVGGLLLAPVAAVTGTVWIRVDYVEFILLWWVVALAVLLTALVLRRRGLLRPPRAPLVSWENYLYCLTRWPLIAWGVTAAVLQAVRPRQITFAVTPKGPGGLEPFPVRLVLPYLLTVVVLAGAALYAEAHTDAAGYVLLCLVGATAYSLVVLALPVLHARESARSAGTSFSAALGRTAAWPLVWAVVVAAGTALAAVRYPAYASAVFGPDWWRAFTGAELAGLLPL
ncbi:glycosyltransferase family 2 protein [Pseudonocardia lacus]|uniref:glycosyltransferase family 2 protein n=1 Tax=Pseudonocardia lacus TaxID=2835865 RepID=UPI001BDDC9C6|nr:glycosyltransferase family 2 protein [Pseudonocardia lacus]